MYCRKKGREGRAREKMDEEGIRRTSKKDNSRGKAHKLTEKRRKRR
jgi:hypothetical protein